MSSEQEIKATWEAHVAENRIKAIHAARSFIAQSPVIFDTETTGPRQDRRGC